MVYSYKITIVYIDKSIRNIELKDWREGNMKTALDYYLKEFPFCLENADGFTIERIFQ